MRFVGERDISKTDGERQGASLRIVEVESCDASSGFRKKSKLSPISVWVWSPASLVSLAWKLNRMSG